MEFFYVERRVYQFDYQPEVPADIRVVVGIDFGTTFSGFAYANVETGEVISNEDWPGKKGPKKVPTVLQYDENFDHVISWGFDALANEPTKRRKKDKSTPSRPVELFKLHLGDIQAKEKPVLPSKITPERAIADYLQKFGEIIKEEVERRWPGIDFFRMVRLVVTVPAEFNEETKRIMRQCIYNAGLINNSGTQNLKFTTEPEAAAIHCMKVLKEHGLKTGDKYLVVDCGGGTVDLTVRKLLDNNQLGEDTERSGNFCGGTYVDKEFLKFLEGKVGKHAIKMLREKHYGHLSYMIQQFCERVKTRFTGEKSDFRKYSLDIEKVCPSLKQYVSGSALDELEEEDWEIDIDFENVKDFFDPVVNKILLLISAQLNQSKCTVMFLVGGFSESKYLQQRIKQKFPGCKVAVPPYPMAAIARGAVEYGLDMDAVKNRVLKWTYGVEIYPEFQEGDPPSRKESDGHIYKFLLMAKRGVQVEVDQRFSKTLLPSKPDATGMRFTLYYTAKKTAEYCDELGMHKLGEFHVDLPDTHLGEDRPVTLELCFGAMEIIAIAKNETSGKVYKTKFELDL
ncbi:actin-like ATPase domain-containing protein [Gigaspora margarita]|uniref:Actin-like ATPase domain-containing protein n=1 Tax=Gigaspora margarita TaxID=4874 RepID=A0A8H4APN2_GIGMA|nr:actin-like ATPase domain-containing protein [Gigaspora margarita]